MIALSVFTVIPVCFLRSFRPSSRNLMIEVSEILKQVQDDKSKNNQFRMMRAMLINILEKADSLQV